MPIQMLPKLFAKPRSAETEAPKRDVRIGIPRVLNQWSTHQFWIALFAGLGVNRRNIVYSSDTSEAQQTKYGQGRGAVDCCYPVKCMTGHYGELLTGLKRPINILFCPKIMSVPSVLEGFAKDCMTCPRVMAGAESTRAGFQRETDVFADHGVRYVSPIVNLTEPRLAARQLFHAFKDILDGLTEAEMEQAVGNAFAALKAYDSKLRQQSLNILRNCAESGTSCILALGRPYHMDTGIGHGIENELQAQGYPVIWGQYLPTDPEILQWLYKDFLEVDRIRSPFDISDIWPTSHSANTNELMWAARYGSLMPWITCVIRFSSYECGMDQPTYTPVQKTVEALGTLFFAFQDLDATKPAGSIKIRVETIAYYLERKSHDIVSRKLSALGSPPWTSVSAPLSEPVSITAT